MQNEHEKKPEDRLVGAVEKIAGAVDRYGVPAVTFAVGAIALLYPVQGSAAQILPWLGCALVVAALITYVWQTARSTTKVHTTPPSVPTEFMQLLDQSLDRLRQHDMWQKELLQKLIERATEPLSPTQPSGPKQDSQQ